MQHGPSNDKERRPPRIPGARFELGHIVHTRGVEAAVPLPYILEAVLRHAHGDWGELGLEDCQANEDALLHGGRILSAYSLPTAAANEARIYVITEADRSATTVLLCEEY